MATISTTVILHDEDLELIGGYIADDGYAVLDLDECTVMPDPKALEKLRDLCNELLDDLVEPKVLGGTVRENANG